MAEDSVEEKTSEVVAQPQSQQTDKEINFAKYRAKVEEEKRALLEEHEELRRKLEEKEKRVEDDDLVDGRVVNNLADKIEQIQENQKMIAQRYEQDKMREMPDRLQSKFPDFTDVVTNEALNKLKQEEPELFQQVTSGNDTYTKAVAAYKTLSRGNKPTVQEEQKKLEQNKTKPVSFQGIKGHGALADANIFAQGLTPELKKQLQREMTEAAKKY